MFCANGEVRHKKSHRELEKRQKLPQKADVVQISIRASARVCIKREQKEKFSVKNPPFTRFGRQNH